MKHLSHLMLTVAICLVSATNSLILNTDQIKALKLARPFIDSNKGLKMTKKNPNLFHRHGERRLSLLTSNSMDMAKESIVTDALNVSELTKGQLSG